MKFREIEVKFLKTQFIFVKNNNPVLLVMLRSHDYTLSLKTRNFVFEQEAQLLSLDIKPEMHKKSQALIHHLNKNLNGAQSATSFILKWYTVSHNH